MTTNAGEATSIDVLQPLFASIHENEFLLVRRAASVPVVSPVAA